MVVQSAGEGQGRSARVRRAAEDSRDRRGYGQADRNPPPRRGSSHGSIQRQRQVGDDLAEDVGGGPHSGGGHHQRSVETRFGAGGGSERNRSGVVWSGAGLDRSKSHGERRENFQAFARREHALWQRG